MKKLRLTLETGTAEITLCTPGSADVAQPSPTSLVLELQDGQQAYVRHTAGDELRMLAANVGDTLVWCWLYSADDEIKEPYSLLPGQLRDPGNSVVLHGWDGDYFVIGAPPAPEPEVMSVLPALADQLGEPTSEEPATT